MLSPDPVPKPTPLGPFDRAAEVSETRFIILSTDFRLLVPVQVSQMVYSGKCHENNFLEWTPKDKLPKMNGKYVSHFQV